MRHPTCLAIAALAATVLSIDTAWSAVPAGTPVPRTTNPGTPTARLAGPTRNPRRDFNARDTRRRLDWIPLIDRTRVDPPRNSTTNAAVVQSTWTGAKDTTTGPPDPNSAVNANYVLNAVNGKITVYNKSGTQLKQDTLCGFFGFTGTGCFDPVVLWDDESQRWYASTAVRLDAAGTTSALAFNYSLTADPRGTWCNYNVQFTGFVDYPGEGDGGGVVTYGYNVFGSASGPFQYSQILRLAKPGPGSSCLPGSSLVLGASGALVDANGQSVFSPRGVDTTDPGQPGWVVARNGALPSSKLWKFKVTPSSIDTAGTGITLPYTYDLPPPATQAGLPQFLDTSNASPGLIQAAKDPANGGALVANFLHTIASSSGVVADVAPVRINLATGAIVWWDRFHTAGVSTDLGAMSSDRRCNGGTCSGGSGWVWGATQSSGPQGINPRAVVVGSSTPGQQVLFRGGQAYKAFDCPGANDICAWGDYAGAEPDPSSGDVLMTIEYGPGSSSTGSFQYGQVLGFVSP
jgi:hypothetical protein